MDWSFGTSSGPGRAARPSRKRVAVAIVTVLALAAGAFVYMSFGSSSGGTALALSLRTGSTYRYTFHMTMNGTIAAAGTSTPFTADMDETFSWKVTSVDAKGVATIDMAVESVTGKMNGQPLPKGVTAHAQIRISRDGSILTGADLAGTGTSGSSFGLPGTDQFTPLLPDHPVKPGDTWSKSFKQAFPFGDGTLDFRSDNTFVRTEVVDGVKTDVIFSRMTVPLDLSIDLRKLLSLTGQATDQLPEGKSPSITYGGKVTMEQTSWFDPAKGELVQTTSDGSFDMTMSFKDFPAGQGAPDQPITFNGTISLTVARAG